MHSEPARVGGRAALPQQDAAGPAAYALAPDARLAIIVPVLNEATLVRTCLERLQPLRARGHEVLLADGDSSDGSAALATDLVDHVVVAARGRALQMNAAARQATAPVLLFLHVDTELPEAADASIARGLARSGACWGRFDVRLSGRAPALRVIERAMNLRSRVTGIATGDQGLFVQRALFDAVGGYPPLPLMEDIALSERLLRYGRPVCLRERVVTSSRRWERDGIARTVLLMWRLRFDYWRGVAPTQLARRYYGD